MSRKVIILSLLALVVGVPFFFVGCGKKTEAELQEEERVGLREVKRQEAVGFYKDLAAKFPEHEKAQEASAKAKALDAQAPPK